MNFQPLLSYLRTHGPQQPVDLMRQFSLSQPTLYRWIKNTSKEVIALGAPRNRRVGALRSVRNIDFFIPIFQISAEGECLRVGELIPLFPSSYAFVRSDQPSRPEFFSGLPYFVDDLRPQGFLGHTFASKNPDLKLPPRITNWNSDDILEAIVRRGENLPGNLLIGSESIERYQVENSSKTNSIDDAQLETKYVEFAKAALEGHPPGSSVGGENPKFNVARRLSNGKLVKVLVKFSPAGNTFSAQRWSDLLICECHALRLLQDHGVAAAEAKIYQAGGRTFLETIRFDRKGEKGRLGLISLSALENQWIGRGENWNTSATFLEHEGHIDLQDLITIRFLECFGRLIGNSDRHSGNLSFFWKPGDSKVRLAPVYDMLPMLYAPIQGEDSKRSLVIQAYDHTLLESWKKALLLAKFYWESVSQDTRLSESFRKLAAENFRKLEDL